MSASTKNRSSQSSPQRPRVEIPQPHPQADPEAALNAVAEYRAALKAWKKLPIWKRMVTPKPRHPSGV